MILFISNDDLARYNVLRFLCDNLLTSRHRAAAFVKTNESINFTAFQSFVSDAWY